MEHTGSLLGGFFTEAIWNKQLLPLATVTAPTALPSPHPSWECQDSFMVQRTDLVKLKIVHSSCPSLLVFARLFLNRYILRPRSIGSLAARGREEEKMQLCQPRL